jgi:ABC-type uncharacterized transport system auxiliary subunit
VLDDTAPYAPRYNLRCGLNRFEADYTAGGSAPKIQVVLDCTFGRYRDRTLLANFTATVPRWRPTIASARWSRPSNKPPDRP